MNSFSIVIPVYNGMLYLKECIESVLNQTFTNYNIIILDSGSNDKSIEFIESYNNSKVVIHRTAKRLTIEENWGQIVNIKTNEYLTILGQDDVLYPNFLEEINNLIAKYPDASLWHSHFNYFNQDSKIIRPCKPMPASFSVEEYTKQFLSYNIDSMGTGYVCRSNDYKKVGGIPTCFPNLLFADFALWLNLTELSYQAISLKNCFAFRIHQSTTTTSSNEKFLNGFEVFIKYLRQKKQNPFIKKSINNYSKIYIDKYTQGIVHRLIKTPLNKRTSNETVLNFINRIKVCQATLIPSIPFKPYRNQSVLLAKLIDSNIVTRKLFLIYKSIFSKPILD